jgi:general secretion pathway protein D
MSAKHRFILIPAMVSCFLILSILLQPATAQNDRTDAASEQLVSIDFNNVDIVVFIKFISDLTKRNFIIDDKVKGKVTIISPGKITVSEAYRVFQSVLEVHGYATVASGQITKIVPSPDARSKSIKLRLQEEAGATNDNVVTQIIPLRYADPNEIKKLFTPLVSKNSVILSYPPTNTLIITDVHSNIRRLMNILRAIDITGVGQQIAIIPVEYADAGKLVTLLNSIFKSKATGKGVAQKDITFVSDERTNSIVLLASEGDTDNIRQLIKTLDKETPKGQAKINVYYLEHATAEDLAKVLQDIPQKDSQGNTPGKKTAPVVSDKVRISADKATNSLIIMADMEDYVVLESIIKKIDIPRAMVYIEALIMEVNVSKDFRLGTEWIIGGETIYQGKSGVYGGGFSAGGFGGDPGTLGGALNVAGAPLAPGFSIGAFGENYTINGVTFPTIAAVVQAYRKDSDVNILSTPQILTTDNQEAKIYVGSNIPYQTQTTANNAGSNLYTSFEYRDVGKTLKITPQISKDRMVRLEISLEVSDVSGTFGGQPTTLKRTVETTAIVKDRNTVVLGGLIDDQIDNTQYKVPCLGDIPGLGYLFKTRANTKEKTNLYVFLTPRVIQRPEEATAVASKKRDQIDGLRENQIKLYRDNIESDDQSAPPKPGIESYQYREDQQPPEIEKEPLPDERPTPGPVSSTPDPDETGKADPIGPLPAVGASEHAAVIDSAPIVREEPAPIDMSSFRPDPVAAAPADRPVADDPVPHRSDPPPSNSAAMATNGPRGYTLQVAAYQDAKKADNELMNLTSLGFAAYTVQNRTGSDVWYRLRVGVFERPEDAKVLMERLRAEQFNPILIKF